MFEIYIAPKIQIFYMLAFIFCFWYPGFPPHGVDSILYDCTGACGGARTWLVLNFSGAFIFYLFIVFYSMTLRFAALFVCKGVWMCCPPSACFRVFPNEESSCFLYRKNPCIRTLHIHESMFYRYRTLECHVARSDLREKLKWKSGLTCVARKSPEKSMCLKLYIYQPKPNNRSVLNNRGFWDFWFKKKKIVLS